LALGPLPLLLGRRRWSEGLLASGLALSAVVLGLTALEVALRTLRPERPPVPPQATYAYDQARGNPEAFRRWWIRYLGEWARTRAAIVAPDPRGEVPGIPIPGASVRFFDSEFHINAHGFRGPELAPEKGERYRIVILGTSTTFGATLEPEHETWPTKLERRIREGLVCRAPIEVINAGRIGYLLEHNLARLERDILPLDPDMIVSFHNHAGFRVLKSFRGARGAEPAPAPVRGSLLVGRVERLLHNALERRQIDAHRLELAGVSLDEREFAAGLLKTELASDYRRLIAATAAHPARLVLCTHPLAVNAESPDSVIRFYEAGFPDVRVAIFLNEMHTRLVKELGRAGGVPVIDTTPGLDGAYDSSYIDLVHFTEVGRERLAEMVFRGLVPLLSEEPRPGCAPRAEGAG
jgi:lysophospholipase L1-like esterase